MKPVLRSLPFILALGSSGCSGCGPLDALADLGTLDPDELVFRKYMGDPGPLVNGGDTTYGGLTVSTTIDGKAIKREFSTSSGVYQTLDYPNGDDTDVTGTGDFDHDGKDDWQYTSTFDGTSLVTTTVLTDTNFDGTFDNKDVSVVDISQGVPFQKTETVSKYLNPDGTLASGTGGTWTQDWTRSGPAIAYRDCGGYTDLREGQAGFPDVAHYTGKLTYVGGANGESTKIQIVDDNSYPGACNDEQTQKLAKAFEAALEDIADCLLETNNDWAGAIKVATQTRRLVVGCGNTCDGVQASTDLPYAQHTVKGVVGALDMYVNGFQRMNFNPSVALQGDLNYLEEVIIHELFHFAGQDHMWTTKGDPEGHDRVYGCGRYCVRGGYKGMGGCHVSSVAVNGADGGGSATIGWGNPGTRPTPQQYAYDCADCVDDAHRGICGTGIFDIPHCSPDDCKLTPTWANCGPSTTCCKTIALNCWGQDPIVAATPHRDVQLKPGTFDTCLQTECMDGSHQQGGANCAVGAGVCLPCSAPEPPKHPPHCQMFPVGWCTQ